MKIRKATVSDIKLIHKLINEFAKKGEMLPRSLNELYENIRDFLIAEQDNEIKGVCALHILWEDLAEIRSLAVKKESQKKGIGSLLVKKCLNEAKKLGVNKVFVLTYIPEFFKKTGFMELDKSKLPQKIWGDCIRCPKFPECDEVALIYEFKV
ncbi:MULTISPECIES: N-acetyltransferase [Thermodesulfovibrio]|uniref:Bifunctional protein argHA n=1 Tax=Thermodesulfovibrio yellowstonii (strain ATCC 51303 / DSM 11347 / YP87) TaxID=289376 RepID=B5YKV6_THEYD|nr:MULTISPECIES: N-acetyltransferase [Thermodesulfovibrio]ACI21303.1 bifunctional protein argHA [Thermodesulfovibrio yellowstonii DSM 11347]MDI6864188.1 N-acetyltransferase [Thermodesulfovibrio yellowstonii]